MDRALFRRRGALRPLPALLGSQGARHTFAALRHHTFLRRLLLYAGREAWDPQPLVLRGPGRLRPTYGNRPAGGEIRADAFGEMEAAQLPHQVVCGRDAVGGNRAGRADRDAAATGARHRRDRGGRQMVSAAHGHEAAGPGESDRVDAQSGARQGCEGRHVRCGQRRRHRFARGTAAHRSVREDGHGAVGVQRLPEGRRVRART